MVYGRRLVHHHQWDKKHIKAETNTHTKHKTQPPRRLNKQRINTLEVATNTSAPAAAAALRFVVAELDGVSFYKGKYAPPQEGGEMDISITSPMVLW